MSGKPLSKNEAEHKKQGLMNLFIPTCEEVSQLTSLSFDEKLTFRKKLGVKIHLMFCKWCRLYRKQLNQIRSLIKKDPLSAKSDFNLSDEFKNKLKNTLEDYE